MVGMSLVQLGRSRDSRIHHLYWPEPLLNEARCDVEQPRTLAIINLFQQSARVRDVRAVCTNVPLSLGRRPGLGVGEHVVIRVITVIGVDREISLRPRRAPEAVGPVLLR
ncbi:hypothetical protein AB0L13_33005 [Saccharopolyspora shandongensis]|uniref:hypothetical protein n=1 Tax=Saccharopolyspora shandongensis TaxID=418495 RepID=UPI0034412550